MDINKWDEIKDRPYSRYTYNRPRWILTKEAEKASKRLAKMYTSIVPLSIADQIKYTKIYAYEIAHNGSHKLDAKGYNIIHGNRFERIEDFVVKNGWIISIKKLVKK